MENTADERAEVKPSNDSGKPVITGAMGENVAHNVATNVIKLREERKVSQTELAKWLGKTPSFVSRLEKGDASVTVTTLCKIAEFFGIPPTVLMESKPESDSRLYIYVSDPVIASLYSRLLASGKTLSQYGVKMIIAVLQAELEI